MISEHQRYRSYSECKSPAGQLNPYSHVILLNFVVLHHQHRTSSIFEILIRLNVSFSGIHAKGRLHEACSNRWVFFFVGFSRFFGSSLNEWLLFLVNGKTEYLRKCEFADINEPKNACVYGKTPPNVENDFCETCHTDGCNLH